MKVKALCTIHCGDAWHNAGDIFETEENLGDLVEVIHEEIHEAAHEPEPVEETPKAKTTRRKKATD